MTRQHQPKAGFWVRLCVVLIYPFDALLFRIRWRHLDRVPPPGSGGVIIAMNHVSNVDTVLMARFVWDAGRIPRFLVKARLFEFPGVGRIMRGAEQIPVYRGTIDAAQSLRAAAAALENGEAVVIYPEGTITRDPEQWPMAAKTGVARLVLLSPGTPVVPVGQWGAQQRKSQPWWRKLGRRDAMASVGEALDLRQYRGRQPTAENLHAITDDVMVAVAGQVAELRGEPAPARFFTPTRNYIDRKAS